MGMWQIEMEPIKDWLDGLDKQTAYHCLLYTSDAADEL